MCLVRVIGLVFDIKVTLVHTLAALRGLVQNLTTKNKELGPKILESNKQMKNKNKEGSVCRNQASHFNQTQERENKSEGASFSSWSRRIHEGPRRQNSNTKKLRVEVGK